ncbi:MAG: NnrU family protein [Mesorhizobium sp.]|uniref:NnrU family protein n=1 Tax=Mesorhizobium sp. TaxID=1871066 RepID=UPI0012074DFC|nr:NnrU family protein [Mesorhizobium sp.]TIN37282.1 MAG: NnrU family protein [Mesorhizobium sp.]TJU88405.1 MAG: NnrU family protein [Mesorhizobium sp.]
MLVLVFGLVIFFGIHSVRIAAGSFRDEQIATNERRWKGLYSLVSIIGFVLIVWGWSLYRPNAPEIYEPPSWGRHVASVLVLAAFVFLAAAYLPTGSIKHRLKHPMLVGIILWAIGHLLANGDLASLLVLGAFLVYAIVELIAVIPRGDPAPAVVRPRSDLIAVGIGLVAFALFGLWLHGWLFGVSPFA